MTKSPFKHTLVHVTTVFGVVTIILGAIMLFVFPMSADLTEGFRTPIIAFEFAKNPADLAFLSGSSEASILNREKMNAGHVWDMVFPFAYSGFEALRVLAPVETLLSELHTATWLKWGALGLSLTLLAFLSFKMNKCLTAMLCAITVLSIVICRVSNGEPWAAETMSAVIFLLFITLAVQSSVQTWKILRPRVSS